MVWYGVIIVLLYSVILPAKCCFSFGSRGCSLSYGGRLRFSRDSSAGGDQRLLEGGRKRTFIFQEPLGVRSRRWGHPFLPGSRGSGLIWKRNSKCRGSQSEQGICRPTEDRPCLDSKMPCRGETPPSYSQPSPLTFSNVSPTNVTVTWPAWGETTDLGHGPIVTYIIEFKESGGGNFHGIRKELELSHQFQNLNPNTEYEFRLVLVSDHPQGEGPPSRVQKQTTPSQVVIDWEMEAHVLKQAPEIDFGETPHGYMPVRNLTAGHNNVGELTLTWHPPDLDPTLYATIGYEVKYVLEKHIACEQDFDQKVDNLISVNGTEVVLNNLQDYASYKIFVSPTVSTTRRTSNIVYQGPTAFIVAQTLQNGPVSTLEPVKESRSFPTTLMFSWNQVLCEDQNGPGFSYNCVLYLIVDGELPKLISEVNVTQHSHVFTKLTSCGNYRLEVTPQNEIGFGETETTEASTSSAAFGPVRDFAFTPSPDQENFTVEWRPPRDSLCPVTSYTLNTTLQRHQACPECVVKEASTIAGIQETSCVLNDLQPYSTYIISITAHGNDGSTGNTFEDVVTTPKRAPSSFPTVMFLGAYSTQTSLTFTWDPVSCKDMNGIFTQYTYSLKETGSGIVVEEGSIPNQSQNQITLSNLTPCTNYTFSIRVSNDAYDGLFITSHGATAISAPGNDTEIVLAPERSEACNDGATCLIATWRKPLSNTCPVEYQKIFLHQIDSDDCRDMSETISSFSNISNTEFQHTFTGLEPNSLYRATLVLGNAVGTVETTHEVRTLESAPSGAPQFVQLRKPIRGTKVNITWEEPVCGQRNGIITEYKYKLSHRGVEIRSNKTSTNWKLIEGLHRGRRYAFTVSAVTKIGSGPYWTSEFDEPFYFRTRA